MSMTTDPQEAKVCPFCGQRPILRDDNRYQFIVECVNDDCPAQPGVLAYSLDNTINLWNQRKGCP